eukprot:CAMPEP_0205802996 /NCGR_PEP_ID=MMETSP0205-20121125/5507_1 /ASSEMBLY_ACC=CAM_ASM_000278 /TAXON_ID=36767 /ORGANISM="Euplotes focardii, Strain TN1" /LENGTH=163 /DNA_ID=CAMNT_0053070347 /DNA_START=115 /DNA_END=607 /DNA_ORIENTATION=-
MSRLSSSSSNLVFGGEEVSDEIVAQVLNSKVKVSLTFNNQEWIEVPNFKYHNISITHIAYVEAFAEEVETEEAKQKLWLAEEIIQQAPEESTEEEVKKWEEDKDKKIADEKDAVENTAKRIGARMYIYGQSFIKAGDNLKLRFRLEAKTLDVSPIFKNSEKLA